MGQGVLDGGRGQFSGHAMEPEAVFLKGRDNLFELLLADDGVDIRRAVILNLACEGVFLGIQVWQVSKG